MLLHGTLPEEKIRFPEAIAVMRILHIRSWENHIRLTE